MEEPFADGEPPVSDPGWPFKGLRILRVLVPVPVSVAGRTRIELIRTMFTFFVAAVVLMPVVLAYALPFFPEGPMPPAVPVLVLASLASPAAARAVRRRALPCAEPSTLAQAYQSRFFLGLVVSEAAALAGFVASFLASAWWPFAVTLLPAAIAYRTISPSLANLREDERRLLMAGCAQSLRRALYASETLP